MERDLTSGSVPRVIFSFSLPYLLSYFLQTLYGMADLFIIGQFNGVESTTAVSIGSQVMHMITVMITGLAMGSTVLIGRAVGAKDQRGAAQAAGNTATMFFALSAVLTLGLLAFVKPVVEVMATPDPAVPGTVSYLTICFAGIPFITAYNVISSVFRGMGDTRSPMYFVAVACGLNIALDYLFIGALQSGAAGAALGTTLSHGERADFMCCHKEKKDDSRHGAAGFLPPETNLQQYPESRGSRRASGWVYPGVFYTDYRFCKQEGDQRCRGSRNCGKTDRNSVPGPVHHAFLCIGAGCTEYRSRKA